MSDGFDPHRRKAILKWIGSAGFLSAGAMVWSVHLKGAKHTMALRPPGADEGFLSACVRCGLCVEACPYLTLKLAGFGSGIEPGTPYFEPRKIPCYMCKDIPCADACPTGALQIDRLRDGVGRVDINRARMGVAVVDTSHCIAYGGIQCDVCYRACPLIDEAIVLEYQHNSATDEHAKLLPMVNAEVCTGCGICERACITQKPTIRVLPRDRVLGETGNHYLGDWSNAGSASQPVSPPIRRDAFDYLNAEGQ